MRKLKDLAKSCDVNMYLNKKVLLRERKRHTAHCIASACYAVPVWGRGGTYSGGGVPTLVGGYLSWWGVPTLVGGYLPW